MGTWRCGDDLQYQPYADCGVEYVVHWCTTACECVERLILGCEDTAVRWMTAVNDETAGLRLVCRFQGSPDVSALASVRASGV